MKRTAIYIATILTGTLLTVYGISQTKSNHNHGDDDDKKKSTKVEKRVEIENVNGEVEVTVTTIKDGKKTVETYAGEEAKAYIENHREAKGVRDVSVFKIKLTDDSDTNDHSEVEVELKEIDTLLKSLEGELSSDQFQTILTSTIGKMGDCNNLEKYLEAVFEGDTAISISMGDHDFSLNVLTNVDEMDELIQKQLAAAGVSIESGSDSRAIVISVNSSIEIEDVQNDNGEASLDLEAFSVYPNPSNGQFKISLDLKEDAPATIKVIDASGKTVLKEKVRGSGQQTLDLDLSSADNGLYLVTITQGKKVSTKRLIIQ